MTTLDMTQPSTGATLPEERWPNTQAYLSEAFAWWRHTNGNRDRDLTFVELVGYLNGAQTLACLAGKLNQQVENGGLGQWVDNRYINATTLRELIDYTVLIQRYELRSSGPGAHSVQRVEILLRQVGVLASNNAVWNDRLQTEDQLERFTEALRQLTPTYVEHGGAFMDAVERYLVAKYPRPKATSAPAPSDALSHRDALREVLDGIGALSNPSELSNFVSDEDLQRRILEAAERAE